MTCDTRLLRQIFILEQTTSRPKRKIVVDEDEDDDLASSEPLAYKRASGRSKKARMSAVFSDEEDAEEEDAPRLNSFAKRLTKYQKSPAKGKPRGTSLYASNARRGLILILYGNFDRTEDRRRR